MADKGLLELDGHPAVGTYKQALTAGGIPCALFAVDAVPRAVERLKSLGVTFTQETLQMGPVTTTVLDDTCRNLVQNASHPR
jgi:hypothetical protein